MERLAWIVLFLAVTLNGVAQNRYVETYEGSRISPEISLDSAVRAGTLDFADCEILSPAIIRYDQRGDTALHETLGATRRDFRIGGDSLWLYRQEWVNRYFQPDSMILFEPDGKVRPISARMRQDQCIHSMVSGVFSSAIYAPQTLIVAAGDTLSGVVAQSYRIDGNITYTDYTYGLLDSVSYPVRQETVYWYGPGRRYPSAVWERYSYTGDSVPAVQYEQTYIFPTYENSNVRPAATGTPAVNSAATTGKYVPVEDESILQALSSFGTFTSSGTFGGTIRQPDGTSALTVEPSADNVCWVLLCDVAGRVLLSRSSSGETVRIDHLPPGDYLLSVSDGSGRCLRKIIIR